jgi:hypothetical protein
MAFSAFTPNQLGSKRSLARIENEHAKLTVRTASAADMQRAARCGARLLGRCYEPRGVHAGQRLCACMGSHCVHAGAATVSEGVCMQGQPPPGEPMFATTLCAFVPELVGHILQGSSDAAVCRTVLRDVRAHVTQDPEMRKQHKLAATAFARSRGSAATPPKVCPRTSCTLPVHWLRLPQPASTHRTQLRWLCRWLRGSGRANHSVRARQRLHAHSVH